MKTKLWTYCQNLYWVHLTEKFTAVMSLISAFFLDYFALFRFCSAFSSFTWRLEEAEHVFFIASPYPTCWWAADDHSVQVRPAALAVHSGEGQKSGGELTEGGAGCLLLLQRPPELSQPCYSLSQSLCFLYNFTPAPHHPHAYTSPLQTLGL